MRNTKMAIDSKNPLYPDIMAKACIVDDIVQGKVRNRRYIPDVDYSNPKRCARHRERAVLFNFTKRTLNSFLGLMFRTQPVLDIPASLDYIIDNSTGNGLNLEQTIRKCAREVMIKGRVGIFVDYPDTELGLDQYTQNVANHRAQMYLYCAETIINWDTSNIDGSEKISLVVLLEHAKVRNGFEWKKEKQYRVLQLNENGNYEVTLYNEKGVALYSVEPKANGKAMKYIPFHIIGSENNDINEENEPILYELAQLNLGHLRNSADFEEAAFLVGQATLFFTSSITQSVIMDELKQKPIKLGSDTGHYLGQSGQPYMLQAQETSMQTKGMEMKEQQAIMLGAAMLVPSGPAETAKTTRMNKGSEVSVLENLVNNLEEGFEQVIVAIADYMGVTVGKLEVLLNHDFIEEGAEPLLMAQMMMGFLNGVAPLSVVRNYWRNTGLIPEDMTDEELDAELAANPPESPDTVPPSN
jgi:hypothetical protein